MDLRQGMDSCRDNIGKNCEHFSNALAVDLPWILLWTSMVWDSATVLFDLVLPLQDCVSCFVPCLFGAAVMLKFLLVRRIKEFPLLILREAGIKTTAFHLLLI
ncbi:hypothetical protein XENOCAPTIV_018090 [Xenoophorus captivus]|uniref:Uncharacterized protein n=1 Tax=Xenoophorus captivus TaxID=1517983 RepID=A0ABV0RAP7_9TELE